MTKPLSLALLLWLTCASAASADVMGEPVQPPTKLAVIPIPIPLLAVGAMANCENLQIGPVRQDLRLLAGYF